MYQSKTPQTGKTSTMNPDDVRGDPEYNSTPKDDHDGVSKIQRAWWVYAVGEDVRGWRLDPDSFQYNEDQPEFLFYLGEEQGVYVHIYPSVRRGTVIAFGVFRAEEDGERDCTEQFRAVCKSYKDFQSNFHQFKVYDTEWKKLVDVHRKLAKNGD